jgi:hypothetical protein
MCGSVGAQADTGFSVLGENHGAQKGIGADFPPDLFSFSLLIIILPLPHAHLSPPPEACYSPDQAAQYHILRH